VLAEVTVVRDERARRLLVGAAARQFGHGGITLMAASTGIFMDTGRRGQENQDRAHRRRARW
jgi:hypothetical protein